MVRPFSSSQANYFDYSTPQNLFNLVDKDPQGKFNLPITEKEQVSHDTYRFRLQFPDPSWEAGMWPAAHFIFSTDVNGEMI